LVCRYFTGLAPFQPHFIFGTHKLFIFKGVREPFGVLDTKNEAKKVKAAKNFMVKLAARKAAQPNSRLYHKDD